MTETMLFIIEAFIGGVVLGATIIVFVWKGDIKDRDQKSLAEQAEAYESGFQEGFDTGRWLKFQERCRIARRCRELEKQITEMQDDC